MEQSRQRLLACRARAPRAPIGRAARGRTAGQARPRTAAPPSDTDRHRCTAPPRPDGATGGSAPGSGCRSRWRSPPNWSGSTGGPPPPTRPPPGTVARTRTGCTWPRCGCSAPGRSPWRRPAPPPSPSATRSPRSPGSASGPAGVSRPPCCWSRYRPPARSRWCSPRTCRSPSALCSPPPPPRCGCWPAVPTARWTAAARCCVSTSRCSPPPCSASARSTSTARCPPCSPPHSRCACTLRRAGQLHRVSHVPVLGLGRRFQRGQLHWTRSARTAPAPPPRRRPSPPSD